ncbi:methyltransferase domain-containing protein [Streptomyces sp. NPDC052040]|uniref:methyltransferase domain-containing protein n=1 Tax=Streptomyces sp. NPDC052040 TaxID=3365682 RepID=UPI0037D98E99
MSATGNIGNFTTVDTAPDSRWFIDFMDIANGLPEYRAMKDELASVMGDLSGKTVLEVGCGTGDDAREVAGLVGAQGKVVATDLSTAMLDEARRRSAGSTLPVEFRVADLSGLDFPANSFDAARAKLVLMHCEDIETAIDELIRVVRPGGRIAVFDYDFDTTIVDHPDTEATRRAMRCFSDGHRNKWSGRQLFRRMRVRGLRDVTVTPLTVVMPFDFFRTLAAGRLRSAQESGQLELSPEQLEQWWRPLLRAADEGMFFASFTGFAVGATKP